MQNPMIENWVQFTHLEKLYGYLPGMDEALLARLFGLDLEDHRGMRKRFDANARDAARELLEDPDLYALSRTTAGRMGATTYLVPPLAVLMGWIVLGEVPPPLALLGGVLCLAGVAVSRR